MPQTAGQPPATASSDSSQNQGNSAPQAQTPPSQSAQPAQAPNSTPNSPGQAKPTHARPRRKRTIPTNCSNAPTPLSTTLGKPADPANSAGAGSGTPASTTAGPADTDAKNGNAPALKPCPPPKKVVRNGGSSEPKVQLTGDTPAEQAFDKSSTDQLRAATEENLKKATALQLNSSRREMVNQIREFMEQSKAAVAAGDLEGAHNLALKAHLLSVELVKP
ncbi:MAG: hypothetical protein WAM13_08015 [Candidatus Sulfotelmatobacter sp.]